MPTETVMAEGGVRAVELRELIEGLDVRVTGSAAVRVGGLTEDSRTVAPGSLFIARGGMKTDGKKFVSAAVAAGAVAVLTDDAALSMPGVPVVFAARLPETAAAMAERFYGNPSRALTLIGITGTNGKTTTAHLVHQMLNGIGVRCGLIGTVVVDDGRTVGPASMTTPPATELSRTFATMVDAGCRAAVMETSSHALDQARVAALSYRVGVFTNLTGDHLDYHGTMEAYGAAKAKLFAMLPEDGWAVVNAEDPACPTMLRACRAMVLRCHVADVGCGTSDAGCDEGRCVAAVESMSMSGTRVEMSGPWGVIETTLRLVGRHNVMNALQAVAACYGAGMSSAAIQRQIGAAMPPPGRLEPVTGAESPFAVFVDYAHTDDALRKVMATARPLVSVAAGGRLAVVFGCGGDRDRTKRPRMGAAAAELADLVYVTSDNPRSEKPGAIIDEIVAGIPASTRTKVSVDADRRRAIERAVENARAGDVVLICGKGHETDQIMADGTGGLVKHHLDDREVAREALRGRRKAAVHA